MSILDGLRHPRARGYEKSYPQGYSPFVAYNEALNDVREALRSDATLADVREVINQTECSCPDAEGWLCSLCDARAVLAFLAGGAK